ncbi:hypothetical protein Daus18300_011243 [Diaporthe australafricana]|uniref:Uncharacterized protein n=1 Tax=Diaporthe australafricana TaxID=127596 RepID=A0ABR3W7C2_9PEZI
MTNLGPLTTTYTATGADCQSTYLAANNDNQWIHGYTCRTGIDRATDPFACASTYASDTYVSVEYYKFTSASDSPESVNTTSKTTTFMIEALGAYVEAYGPVVRRSAGDPEWSSTTASTTTDSTTSSSDQSGTASNSGTSTAASATSSSGAGSSGGGLSVGASAGIGVGVGLGCIIFIACIAAAYIIGKRKRAAAKEPDGPETPPYREGVPAPGQTAELTSSDFKPWELPGAGYQQVPEMDGHEHRSEMAANSPPIELQASQGHGVYR